MQCAFVNPGDSFIFPKGTYHSWLNAYESDDYNTYYDITDSPTSAPTASPGPSPAESTSANGGSGGGTGDVNVASEQLVTVTTFLDAAPPDASLLMVSPTGPDSDDTLDDAVPGGVVGSLVVDGGGSLVNGFGPTAPLVSVTIGNFDLGNVEGPQPNSGSPLFPQITGPSDYGEPSACRAAQIKADDFTNESDDGMGLRSPIALFETNEVETGVFATGCDGPCGGGARLVSGAAWPLLGDNSVALQIVSYCGVQNLHVHTTANEWGTVLNGTAYVMQYPVNSPANITSTVVRAGETYYVPAGAVHWFVNAEPGTQFATISSYDGNNPDVSFLVGYVGALSSANSVITDTVLGEAWTPPNTANPVYPLLSGALPAGCGGDTPCESCGDVDFLANY